MTIRNKMAKSFPMWSKGSIIIAQFSKYKITISQNSRSFSMLSILKMLSIFSGSRGTHGPDLPSSPFGRKFHFAFAPTFFLQSLYLLAVSYWLQRGKEKYRLNAQILQFCIFLRNNIYADSSGTKEILWAQNISYYSSRSEKTIFWEPWFRFMI